MLSAWHLRDQPLSHLLHLLSQPAGMTDLFWNLGFCTSLFSFMQSPEEGIFCPLHDWPARKGWRMADAPLGTPALDFLSPRALYFWYDVCFTEWRAAVLLYIDLFQ